MNSAARTNLTETALYLEVYAARVARSKAVGTADFAAANKRVGRAFAAVLALRAAFQVAA